MSSHRLQILAGVFVFVVTLIVTAPASLIAPILKNTGADIRYQSIEGTLWRGKIVAMSAEQVALGDVDFQLAPASLFILSPRAAVRLSGGAVNGRAIASASVRGLLEVRDAEFHVDLVRVARRGILGEPVRGVADVKINELAISRAGCRKADATIWTDVFDAPARRYDQSDSFPVNGVVTCDGEKLAIALEGTGGPGAVSVTIKVAPNQTYEMMATARPARDDVAAALRYFGFEDADGALTYGAAGVLNGVGS